MRDELLSVELFSSLTEAQVMVADRREDYNERRPHSALAMTAPARFARAWRQSNGPPGGQAARGAPLREAPRHAQHRCNPKQTTDSHNSWADERGPASGPIGLSSSEWPIGSHWCSPA